MPNIEIHSVITGRETSLRIAIFDLLKNKKFADDVVVTVERTSTITENSVGTQMAFLRIFDSNSARADEIAMLLANALKMDVEVTKLQTFYPKPE